MKKILIALISVSFSFLHAQDNVGIGTLTPNTLSILDLSSNNKGFLAPRMTTSERTSISTTASEQGLLVFDTNLKFYFYWDGTQWVQFPGNDADSDPTNEYNTGLSFDSNGNILTITDGGTSFSTPISININDADSDSTNEYNTSLSFDTNGNILTITDGGTSFSTPISINVNDADSDSTNEYNTSFVFDINTNNFAITDAGGTLNTSIQPLIDNLTTLINNINNTAGNDWKLTGNAGTTPATNYIGTSDAAGLSIRTNATERIRVTQSGFVGIGQAPSYPLDVLNQTRITRANTSLGTVNESHLELFNGSTGDVYISFHKAGVYGAHFGLDNTNWFSTLGWSAGAGYTNMRVGSSQVNGTIQITGGNPQANYLLSSTNASGNATWVDPSTVLNSINNNNNYTILPTGSHVGLCVRNTNNGCCNCNDRILAPITGWGSGCPAGYSFEQISARWNGLNERWVYACIKN
jgi:hypothetical protein